MVDIACLLESERRMVEEALDRCLPLEGEYPPRIHEAIRYSALNGGKRIRPILTLAATRALGLDATRVVKAACALEFIHCCSLVLDDLPSMDDASVRRGKPTTHRVFGIATAILAADALLMHAFKLVADNGVETGADGPTVARAIRDVATAVGSYGMVGGQHVDLEAAKQDAIDPATLDYIQSRKTGALFVASATIGGTLWGTGEERLAPLADYSRHLGLAYQIVDDLLDVEGDVGTVGKDVHQDADKGSFVTVHGLEGAREAARNLGSLAKAALDEFEGDPETLGQIVDFCLSRTC